MELLKTEEGYLSGYETMDREGFIIYMDNDGDQLFLKHLSKSQLRSLAYAILSLAER